MSDPEDLVSVYQATSPTEAYFVKNLLEAEGIKAAVSELNEPLAGLPLAAIDVLVREADVSAADKIVEAYNDDIAHRDERPNWTCPKCGERMPDSFDECCGCGAERPT